MMAVPGVMLLPHGSLQITVADKRSRRLVDDAMDEGREERGLARGVLAVASLSMRRPAEAEERGGAGGLRSAVCVAKVVKRSRHADGRETMVLAGICRARILALFPPDGEAPYQRALVDPIEERDAARLGPAVADLCELLGNSRLSRLADSHVALQMLRDSDIPGSAAIDIAGLILMRDEEERYRLLSVPSARERARIVYRSLYGMDRLIQRADEQRPESWPKGMSWN